MKSKVNQQPTRPSPISAHSLLPRQQAYKKNRTKEKLMGFEITNQVTEYAKELIKEEACNAEKALVVRKIEQNIQAANDKKMEKFMAFTKDMLK